MASHPVKFILVSLLLTGLALIGMINYRTENNAFKLWIPDNSDFVTNYLWLEENSPPRCANIKKQVRRKYPAGFAKQKFEPALVSMLLRQHAVQLPDPGF